MKKKNFVCVFAHPDDEAFGPSGTIHKLTKKYNVYILCATKGQQGQDALDDTKNSLGNRRAEELRESARIIGVKKVYFLGFRDGTLSNNLYHKLAYKIHTHLEKLKPEEIMTFGLTGVSGHIDHITVGLATSFVAQKLSFIKKIYYTVIPLDRSKMFGKDYFIYMPEGTPRSKIDKIIAVSDIWDIKLAAMKCHKSQKSDFERIQKLMKHFPKEEYFMVKMK